MSPHGDDTPPHANLHRLARDADEAVGLAYDAAIGWAWIVGFVLATMFANSGLIKLGLPAQDMGTYALGTVLVVLGIFARNAARRTPSLWPLVSPRRR